MLQFIRYLAATALLLVPNLTAVSLPSLNAFQEVANNTQTRHDQYGDPLPDGALARMGTIRLRHVEHDAALAFSSDGKILACGGKSALRLWELPTGKLQRVIPNPSRPNESGNPNWADDAVAVKAVGFFSDGRLWSFACNQKRAMLYEPITGKVICQLKQHLNELKAVSPDGNLLATVDSTAVGVELVSPATGKTICKLGKAGFATLSVTFSPNGKMLATCDWDGESNFIRLWTVPGGNEIRSIPLPGHTAYQIIFAPDGKSLVACLGPPFVLDHELQGDFSLVEIDAITGKERRKIGPPGFVPFSIAISSDGKILAGIEGSTIRLLDVNTNKMLGERRGHESAITALSYQPDGKAIVSASADESIRFWDSSTAMQQRVIDLHQKGLRAVAVSEDARLMAVVDARDVPHTLDLPTARIRRSFQDGDSHDRLGKIALSAEGRILAVQNSYLGGGYRLWDTTSGMKLKSPDKEDSSVVAVDVRFGRVAGVLEHGRTIEVRDLATGAEFWRATDQINDQVVSLKFSPDGVNLASCQSDQSIRLWDVVSGKSRRFLVKHPSDLPKFSIDGVRQLPFEEASFAFSPDGKTIASGGSDSTVRLWDTTTAKELQCFTGHQGRITAIAFSPDGRTLASGSDDTSILVWNLASQSK